jgi:alpha-glucosidase (family GH31 glycosyl hydrolase)
VSSVFSLESPEDEGLYGLGARKDSFDQRGLLRNVWTEEQNASDERVEPITCPALGCDYTFPNGAQAAYLVQPSVHGSRGWTGWVAQTELSRVDLAASRPDVVRWGVASPRLTLSLAGGGLERSAAAHTADVGRAPAPPAWVYEPWVDVINEGEGEAAPNGGGFTGGARVRADLEDVVRRSRELGLPVGVLGVEGWQVVPTGPSCSPTCGRRATGCRRTGTRSTRPATRSTTRRPGATCSSRTRPASRTCS